MAVGMTTVFAFLGILVISMHVLARVADLFPPVEPPERGVPLAETNDADIAVVLAAIKVWRQSNTASTGRG
jgi:Na+-transporting methylmalonyl-CoA/oxaloacetate decarboxylase gamma subunit